LGVNVCVRVIDGTEADFRRNPKTLFNDFSPISYIVLRPWTGLAVRVLELVTQPVKSLVQTVARCSAGRLDIPVSVPQTVQSQLVSDFSSVHRVRQILFVGEDEQDRLTQLVLGQHPHQLVPRLADPFPVVTVHHEDEPLGVLEVMSPQRSDLVLATDVPHGEADVLVLDRLNVETDGRYCGDNFSQFELVEDGCFTGSIQPHHQYPHFLLTEQTFE